MAVLKAINGHTGCGRIKDYLEKGGRALMRDFFNLSWDEVEDLRWTRFVTTTETMSRGKGSAPLPSVTTSSRQTLATTSTSKDYVS